MSVVFIGSTVDRETLKALPAASVAGNKMELGFVKGFLSNGLSTIALSVEAHGMWKLNGQPIFVCGKHLVDEQAEIITIPYLNLPVIKQLMIPIVLKWYLRKLLKKDVYRDSTLLVYNTMSIFAIPVLSSAKKRGLNAIAVIADLPIQEKKSWVRRIEDRKQIDVISKFDALIPLTKHIVDDFAPSIPYCVVEAGCNPGDYTKKQKETDEHGESYDIVFSGTLNQLSGIELMIETMDAIDNPKITLHIYGDGPLRPAVEEASHNNGKIVYHGRVNNVEMLAIQEKADLLVCPRKRDDFTTKYTFPSKVLEYICSGVPVLSNRLQGIPDEYEQYITFAKSEKPKDWATAINDVFAHNEVYRKKATSARKEVLINKSWHEQTRRVIETMCNHSIVIK